MYVHAHVSTLRRTKSRREPQLVIKGVQATKGLTWFREGDVIYNHIWPDVDRRKGLKVDTKKSKPKLRPSTDAPRHKATLEYDESNSMKTIQSAERTRQMWQESIDKEEARVEALRGNLEPQEA